MRDLQQDRLAAEAELGRVLVTALSDVETRPLPEVLDGVTRGLLETLPAGWATITVRAADGQPELVVTGGDLTSAAEPSLSVPLLLRGRPAGAVQLGVAGGEALDDAVAAVVHAAALGVAGIVERARTVAANRRRERWLTGGTEIARALTGSRHAEPLTLIARHAAEIADADTVMLLTAGSAPGLVRVEASAGVGAVEAGQQIPDTDGGHVRRVLVDGRALRVDDLAAATSRRDLRIDAAMLVPMHGSSGLRGVLAFGRATRGGFSDAELGMATMFASTVTLAVELAESQNHREQTALVLERDRIARDLHDHVIQRLYAIGLTIQYVTSMVGPAVADRLVAGVTDIDAAISQIRSTIFRLTTPILGTDVSLRARAEVLVDELELVLGYRPTLVSEGPLDFGLDDELIADCEAVLREGITNIARHAQASAAHIAIVVARNEVRIEIADDGRGLGDTDRRSGLGNLRRRAEQHGGTLEIIERRPAGTRLIWTVPLRESHV